MSDITFDLGGEGFFFFFPGNLPTIYQVKNATEFHVLFKLCSIAEFNTNKVQLPTAIRAEVCKELKITAQNFTNCLRSLRNAGLLAGERGLFRVNPAVIWKGSTKERDRLLASEEGMTLLTQFKPQV